MGAIVLYEGNGGSQGVVDVFFDWPFSGLGRRPERNDEARSLVLASVRVGTTIWLKDSKSRGRDNLCSISVVGDHRKYVVDSFERSYRDEIVKVTYHPARDGARLDGKVSWVIIANWDVNPWNEPI